MPRKVFVAGEILTASDVNTNLMDQSVMVFDDATARTTAIPTPVEGMVTYLKDANQVQAFTGSAFTAVGTILQVVSVASGSATNTTSETPVATNMVATITPSSTDSKVLIHVSVGTLRSQSTSGRASLRLFRGGVADTGLGTAAVHAAYLPSAIAVSDAPASIVFVDTPGTTSSQTYTVGLSTSGSANSVRVSGQQTIVLMEVAG